MSESRHYYNSAGSSEPYLGFANLPNQVHRKSAKKGFEFSLIVVGESGLGKSTLISSLFESQKSQGQSQLYRNRKSPIASLDSAPKTVEIHANQVEIEERGVKLKLTVIDTPGFGDALDNRDCIPPIIDYIDDQYERFLEYESGLNRKHITDSRVHCCFYFISPIGHGLRPIDIEFMKQLHQKVNIVPIISKADIFTKDELSRFKKRILSELQAHRIQVYSIPDCDSDEEQEYKQQIKELRAAMPFAVCASLESSDGLRKTHGRQYNWGTVVMENPSHCDFVQLRQFLVTHMQEMREVTNEVHYENFRCTKLASRVGGIGSGAVSENECGPSSLNEQQKDRILLEKEEELRKMQQMIAQMQKQMNKQQQLSSN